ncbi:MAG: hypothetical protein CMH41_10345 [Micrococcales bacterium]|nr:hypothetical protein [Micrococcales bacterium]
MLYLRLICSINQTDEMDNVDLSHLSSLTSDDRASKKRKRFFANLATVKGLILVVAGGIALLAPQVSLPIVRLASAVALIVWGLTEVWTATRYWRDVGVGGLSLALISIVTGVGILLVAPGLEILLILSGTYLFVRGVVVAIHLIFRRNGQIAERTISALLQITLGIMLFFLPDAVATALFGFAALTAVSVGSIFLYYGFLREQEVQDLNVATLAWICKRWLRENDLGFEVRSEIAEGLYFEEPQRRGKLRSWWTMLGLSVLIATFGILQDSTAVVIGAMLIAPLMIPILGAAGAIVNGRRRRLLSSLALVLMGAGMSIFVAFAVGRWTPDLIQVEVNSQIASRVSPNLIDMGIALAAGAAGAFATVNRRVAGSIAGVAIAVALVPPLGVAGLTLEIGEFALAWGAFLLFLANFVAILLSATLVFALGGWVSVKRLRAHVNDVYVTAGLVGATAMVVIVPLLFTQQGIVSQARNLATAAGIVDRWVGETNLDLAVQEVEISEDTVTVRVQGSDAFPDPDTLGRELGESLNKPIDLDIFFTPTEAIRYRAPSNP